ncbi:homoserine kinase [Leucobacter chromiireducens]|uniref:Homoserine kinase n=1 Tax=Leucobacter chromiireducens subsp. solipictus TaxID=398235 RepID=A0ABS1SHM9_9MICO|nr:homoserine kinase [Leucobacter chromiireducens]MBL3679911.1 homoserine kinase [Leucobacter chromiireducens subsp. solipictus]
MSGAASRAVRVHVPSTSANLGPGFDTLGIALAYGDDLTAVTRPEAGATVAVTGVGAGEVPTDASNLVVRSAAHVYERLGRELPGLNVEATNRIPHGRGMGSSGSAIVAGVMIAAGLLASDPDAPVELTEAQLLAFATELEGHPDNVAPALFGGLTIAWSTEAGPQFKRLLVHRGVAPLVLVPSFTMSTELARSLQPEQVPHEDAVFNVSRSALLIAALTQSPELLMQATEDRLHQDYRGDAMPATRDLIRELRAAGHPAVVSGAGPSILVLSPGPAERQAAADLVAQAHPDWRVLLLAVDTKGATVEEIPA